MEIGLWDSILGMIVFAVMMLPIFLLKPSPIWKSQSFPVKNVIADYGFDTDTDKVKITYLQGGQKKVACMTVKDFRKLVQTEGDETTLIDKKLDRFLGFIYFMVTILLSLFAIALSIGAR